MGGVCVAVPPVLHRRVAGPVVTVPPLQHLGGGGGGLARHRGGGGGISGGIAQPRQGKRPAPAQCHGQPPTSSTDSQALAVKVNSRRRVSLASSALARSRARTGCTEKVTRAPPSETGTGGVVGFSLSRCRLFLCRFRASSEVVSWRCLGEGRGKVRRRVALVEGRCSWRVLPVGVCGALEVLGSVGWRAYVTPGNSLAVQSAGIGENKKPGGLPLAVDAFLYALCVDRGYFFPLNCLVSLGGFVVYPRRAKRGSQ